MTTELLDKIDSAISHGRPRDAKKLLGELRETLEKPQPAPTATANGAARTAASPTPKGPRLVRRTLLGNGIEVLDPLDPGLPRTIVVNHAQFTQFAGDRERILQRVAQELRRG